jgi:hypothetical protein
MLERLKCLFYEHIWLRVDANRDMTFTVTDEKEFWASGKFNRWAIKRDVSPKFKMMVCKRCGKGILIEGTDWPDAYTKVPKLRETV